MYRTALLQSITSATHHESSSKNNLSSDSLTFKIELVYSHVGLNAGLVVRFSAALSQTDNVTNPDSYSFTFQRVINLLLFLLLLRQKDFW